MSVSEPVQFLDQTKALACIHCGLCLASCPTYLETGNENDSPRGRIYLMRALQEGRMELGETPVRHLDLCLGCRACEAVCPSGVQYGALLEHTRDHIEHHHSRSLFATFLRRIAIEQVFPFPERLRLALMPARLIQALRLEWMLPKFAREAMALLPTKAEEVTLPVVSRATGTAERGRVGFISGCVMSVLFGRTNAASVRVLNRAGFEVITPLEQGCCGALYAHSGQLERARTCARHNIEVFERQGLSTIVINAAGCGSTLKEYGELLHDDPAWVGRARTFSAKVRDLTEVLPATNPVSRGCSGTGHCGQKVTYHDACHLAHPQHITKQPRDLIRAVVNGELVDLPESEVCCGSAGSYNLTEPEMAERLQKRKVDNIVKTGAKIVVTTNPGCLLQIRAGLRKAGVHDVEALHIADYLDREG